MRVNRRQFLEASAIAVVAGSACGGGTDSKSSGPAGATGAPGPIGDKPEVQSLVGKTAPAAVQVDFEGLFLIEDKGTSAYVHLIDATAVDTSLGTHLGAHLPRFEVLASTLKTGTGGTTKPDAAHVRPAGSGDEFWSWDLKGQAVTFPPSDSGGNDLGLDPPNGDDSLDVPSNDDGWHSLSRLPDLKKTCGATKVDPLKKNLIASSITATHGAFSVQKPKTHVGQAAVWKFKDPNGNQLLKHALSNLVRFTCPTGGKELTIMIGTVPVVFLAAGTTSKQPGTLTNLPVTPPPACPNPCTPNMHHFKALCAVMDSTFDPVITVEFTPDPHGDAGADYCPGGHA